MSFKDRGEELYCSESTHKCKKQPLLGRHGPAGAVFRFSEALRPAARAAK